MTHTVPLNSPTFTEEEINAAITVLRSGQLTMGKLCEQFERQFAQYLNTSEAIFVNSGSSANLLAFFALTNPALKSPNSKRAFSPGSEIIVPAVTWSTTIWPIVQAGAVPVLVDSDPETLQMNPEKVKSAITDKTFAICPVHVLGNSTRINQLKRIAEENDLWLIEDTCEALGTRHQNQFCGTFGDIGTFSFYFSHHITTIEGGMLVTKDEELADLIRCLRAHGWTRHMKQREKINAQYPEIDERFLFVNMGFNLRPTEINAAFGLAQLPKLDQMNQARRQIAEKWNKAFAPLNGKLTSMQTTKGTESTWFGYPVLCDSQDRRKKMQLHLENKGIETRPIICGNLARQPAFKMFNHRISGKLTGADEIMQRGLYWGSHPLMDDASVDYVIQTVLEFFNHDHP